MSRLKTALALAFLLAAPCAALAQTDNAATPAAPVADQSDQLLSQGELDALNRLMDLSIHNLPLQWHPDRTFLVPGHGNVYDKLDLLEYRDAMTIVRDRVQDLIDEGKTLAQVKAANPTLGYRSQYGADSGPSLSAARAARP